MDIFLDVIPEDGYDQRTERITRIIDKVKATVPEVPEYGI